HPPNLLTAAADQPPTSRPLPAGSDVAATRWGDVVAVATDSGVLVMDPLGRREATFIALSDHPRALVFSPSGHRIYVARRTEPGLAAIDRYDQEEIDGVALPLPAEAIRLDPLGRWLLAKPTGGDSVWGVDLPVKRLLGSVPCTWRVDLPAISPDGSLLVPRGNDIVAYRPDSLIETGRAKGGASDFWMLTAWRPRGSYRGAFADADAGAAAPADQAAAADTAGPEGPMYVQVSTSQNEAWSSEMAQQLTRAGLGARVLQPKNPDDGYRVVLVDLWLERPTLHEVVGLSPAEGIVDAFEYDVSLTKAAHEVDRVFFIAAGTVTAHAGDLFANPRWRKLHGGFRSEDALLLLYLSAGALARLSTVPDGLIVLSADGYEPESSIGQGITAAMERGIPLLGVVRERWTPLATPAPDP